MKLNEESFFFYLEKKNWFQNVGGVIFVQNGIFIDCLFDGLKLCIWCRYRR